MVELRVGRRNACIVVLGDIGRSPRMEYHAQSLIEENFNVDIIGYTDTKILDSLTSLAGNKCIIHELSQVPESNLPPKLKLIFKTMWQIISLLMALISIRRPNFLLVQNPPAIPTLMICYLYCIFTRAKFVIDWHNYAHSILALSISGGDRSILCRLAKWMERYFGSKTNANFCVSDAMKKDLIENWKIGSVKVLHDRPPEQFHPIDLMQKHELFMKLSKEYSHFMAKSGSDFKESGVLESTAFTQKLSNGAVNYKAKRSAILVSSTSWTPDEDFSILIKALKEYDIASVENPNVFPSLLCVITGKGPQKELYQNQICQSNWKNVSIITPWLEVEDYPKLLGVADLGVCLHWSSSGLDLPMKVVDMFGCGLPVCAYNYKCLNELVHHEENGFIFNNHMELAEQLKFWFENFPDNSGLLGIKDTFQKNLKEFQALRWHKNWTLTALPVFNTFT